MLVVESTSIATATNTDTVTVTKPTGVEVGDLLLIATHKVSADDATCTGFSVAQAAYYDAPGSIPNVGVTLLYRIADASDVAAANYTINHASTTDSGIVSMLRISGWTTGNPVHAYASDQGYQDDTSFTRSATGLSLSRPTASAVLLMLNAMYANTSPVSSASFSGYSVTSGVANPSWTEVQDTHVTITSGLYDISFSCAYAVTTDTSDVTGFSVTGATDTGGGEDSDISLLIVIVEPSGEVLGTNALFETSPTLPTQHGVAGAVGSNALLDVSPSLFDQSATVVRNTNWTNESKPTTNWNNEA